DPRNQPMQGKEACGAGQFHCNGACVPQGTACNGYPYFQPGKRMEGEMTGRDPKGQPMPRRPMHGNMRGGPGMDTRRVGQGGDMKNGEENMGGPEMKGEGDMNDEQQQQMDEQRFNMMKRGLQQFANGVKQMEKMIKRTEPKLAKNGVSVPPELKAALAKAPELVEKIKQATSADELEDLMDEVQDVGDTMQEWGPKFGELMRLSEMISRAGQDVKMLDKAVKRLGTAAKKNTVIADAVTQLQSQVTTMKTTLEEVKALAKTDPEAALETLEDGFYGNMEEFWNSVAEVDMVANVSKGLGQAKSEIAKAERRVKALEKSKKVDAETIASLRELLESIKASAKNMEGIAKKTPIDFEEVKSGAEELWQLVEEFENKMADLGEGNYEPKVQRGENVQFELPEGFGSGPRNSQQSGFGAEDGSNSFGGF
ncbi:MAG TPA: hypothetical protein VEA18_02485, partial [Candidatus Kapabacteria bacterium]|nr:hypothetical protein [Candidatus Kapabacteria bacterium]